MVFRVTPNVFVSQTIRAAQRHAARLSNLQSQTSSGLRLLRPSDDPAGTRAILGIRAALGRMDVELANITAARQRLGVANAELLDAGQVLTRIKEIAIAGRQSVEPSERDAYARELDGLKDRLLTIANARHNGEYLFAGVDSREQPFQIDGAGRVTYSGSEVRGSTDVGRTFSVDVLYSGSDVFQFRDRGETLYVGTTGAAAAQGTDNGAGTDELLVLHTATTYAGGSGVAAGTGSVAGDTILGPAGAHTLTINDTSGTGASGTISLNGGPPVAFTSADTNLAVTGPEGELVYIDTTAVTAGFSGTVNITADGALSTDGGATQTAINFSASQTVTDGETGAVTHVNTTNIRRTGAESLDYTGTADVFTLIDELHDDLLNEGLVGTSTWHASMDRHMTDIERLQNHILDSVGEQAVALENLDAIESRTHDLKLEQQRIAGEIEGADLAEVVLRLQQEQTMLQYTLASSAQLFSQSLVDYL
jgi:flagellar hook-associated protein 3